MANAPLTIRFGSDVDAAKKGVTGLAASIATNMASVAGSALAAGKTVQSAAQTTITAFQGMNKAAGLVAPALFGIATAFVVFKTAESAIGAMRKELADVLEIADKASARGLSPTFFQAFIAGGKGAADKVKELEEALDRAFQATKDVLNPNWTVWDQGLTKVTAVEEAMRGMRELFSTDQSFTGLDLFRNAQNQDQKIQAVLTAMKELNAIGQRTAALDLGEKMFGAQFADQIRRGQESVDKLLDTITKKLASPEILSDETVKRAKELDDRLNDAWRTINERMKPDWSDLGDIALRIKGVWTSIIEAVAAYKVEANKANLPMPIATDESARNNPDVAGAAFANPVILNQGRRRRGQAADISPAAPIDESRGLDMTRREMPEDKAEAIPLPSRRPLDAPKPPEGTVAPRDAFQSTMDQINKHMAAIKAEAATIDANTATRDRAKAVAQLEEAAKRANTAAGKENTTVTDEQRAAIEKQADALMQVVAAAEQMKVNSSIRNGAATAFLTSEDVSIAQQLRGIYGNDIPAALASTEAAAMRLNNANREIAQTISTNMTTALADVFDGTKSAGEAFADFAKIALRAIEETIIKLLIVGPLMRSLQGGLGGLFGFADGGEVGAAGSISVGGQSFPKFASGGVIAGPGTGRSDSIMARVSNGEFIVNAAATSRNRRLLDAINSGAPAFADGGYVNALPSASSGSGGGGVNVTVISNPTFQAGMTPTDMAQIRSMMAQNTQVTKAAVIDGLRGSLRNDSSYLG